MGKLGHSTEYKQGDANDRDTLADGHQAVRHLVDQHREEEQDGGDQGSAPDLWPVPAQVIL